MIDALRRDAWPRGVRRQRRELEAAREELRRELGAEPSLADLATRVGSDEARLERTIVRINTIESTSPLSAAENVDSSTLPAVLVPREPTVARPRLRGARSARPRARGDRRAAAARAQGRRPLLLRRSDDEADRRRDRRQRIARLAAARARDPAPAEVARRGLLDGGRRAPAAPRDPLVPADDDAREDGQDGRGGAPCGRMFRRSSFPYKPAAARRAPKRRVLDSDTRAMAAAR